MVVLFYEEAYETVASQFDHIRNQINTKNLTGNEAIEEMDKLYGEVLALCARFEEEFEGRELEGNDKLLLAKLSSLLNQVIIASKNIKGHKIRQVSPKNPYHEVKKQDDAKELNLKERIPLHYLRNFYTAEEHSAKLAELEKQGYRDLLLLKKDGNCFYRGVYVQLIEQGLKNDRLLQQCIDTFLKMNTDDPKISIDRIEILDILQDALKCKAYLGGIDPLDHFATNTDFDLGMVRIFRKLAADYLRAHQDKPVLNGLTPKRVLEGLDYSVERFLTELEAQGTEAELVALDLLPLALNIRVYIADFLGKNLAIIEHGSGEEVAHLLNRPGRHFDILYK